MEIKKKWIGSFWGKYGKPDFLKILPAKESHCAAHALEAFNRALDSIIGLD